MSWRGAWDVSLVRVPELKAHKVIPLRVPRTSLQHLRAAASSFGLFDIAACAFLSSDNELRPGTVEEERGRRAARRRGAR